jgi:hypothetical protein
MLPFGVTIPATVPQRSEIPEGLMNYPILISDKSSKIFMSLNFSGRFENFLQWEL